MRLRLSAAYPDHTPAVPTSVEVWVSFDDGQRWEPVSTTPLGYGRVQAMLPSSGG